MEDLLQQAHIARPAAGSSLPVAPDQDLAAGEAGKTALGAGAAAYAQGLDGSERKLLLTWIAATNPTVVDRGAQWLADYHAANAEGRRADRNGKAKDRRRRRRADIRKQT